MKTFTFFFLVLASIIMLIAESKSITALLITKGIAIILILITAKFYTANRKDLKGIDKWMEE
jgi:hypothetical protein